MEQTALDVLAEFHSWQLNRISVSTFPNDVVATVKRKGQPMSEAEIESLVKLIRGGHAYRCRIGKGRFFFGTTALQAAEAAAAAEKQTNATTTKGT